MPPACAAESFFNAFFTSSRAGGTGLGLVIAADLVRAHGGSLVLAPPHAGADADDPRGATFRITLPASPGRGGGGKGFAGGADARSGRKQLESSRRMSRKA